MVTGREAEHGPQGARGRVSCVGSHVHSLQPPRWSKRGSGPTTEPLGRSILLGAENPAGEDMGCN